MKVKIEAAGKYFIVDSRVRWGTDHYSHSITGWWPLIHLSISLTAVAVAAVDNVKLAGRVHSTQNYEDENYIGQ